MTRFSFLILILLISMPALAGWKVDCSNYCFFNDIQPNCQGVYWEYPNGERGYSVWNPNQNGCLETDLYNINSHLIYPSQISCNCSASTLAAPSDRSAPMSSATRNKLELLRAQVQSWAVCGPDPAGYFPNIFSPVSFRNSSTCQELRKKNKGRVYNKAMSCFTGLSPSDGWPWVGCGYNYDHVAATPSLCFAKDPDGCAQIKDSQDPVSGAWYRNPYMRRHPEVGLGMPGFSRDQTMGMMSYWAVTKDKVSALKWLNFVKQNGKAPWGGLNLYNLCPPRPNIPKPPQLTQAEWDGLLPDDRCGLIPEAWGLIYAAVKSAGVTDAQINNISSEIFQLMSAGYVALEASLPISALTAPATGSSAYQIANVFDSLALMIYTGHNQSVYKDAAVILNERTGKINPLYHYLAEGKATEYGAYLIRKYCSAPKPGWGLWYRSGYQQLNNNSWYWVYGKSYIYTNYQYAGGMQDAYSMSTTTGYDCLAFLHQYLGNANLTELACDGTDKLIDSACLKVRLTPPGLAPVNGIDFKINAWNGRLSYMAIDQSRCPLGGTLGTVWPKRCELPSGLGTESFNPQIGYQVDPTPTRPGIFYDAINSTCPFGGNLTGNRCQIFTATKPTLASSVRYWVDPNLSAPGVYYAQVSGQCPYGGVSDGNNCRLISMNPGVLDPNKQYFTRANNTNPGVYYYPRVVPEIRIKNPIDMMEKINSSKVRDAR